MVLEKTTENTTTRMAGDERRLQILQVAMSLFSKNGFAGTTTKKIAEAAGVSEATVFKHFANKEELYADILDHKACNHGLENPFEEITAELAAKDDFGVFYRMALNAFKQHKKDRDFMRLLLHSALEGHDLARMFFESYIVGMYDFLSAYIRQRQKDGAFREVEPKIVVRSFVGMMIHHSLNNTLWDKEQKLLKISDEDAAREFTTILLNGIKK
ncbi:MAG: TetR/AcrR family transcriptional regulator [Acidobacteriota bacterium]|nr:TetR/AcrR family transcriptional regulator [Acidobacteriota bacterium]